METSTTVLDLEPSTGSFQREVVAGLRQRPKRLPCKYLYDERGSQLFDEICGLQEYYLTRTELTIMHRYAGEMAEAIGPDALVVEFGSGSSVKTRLLLNQLASPAAYVPLDISREHLKQSADNLSRAYPRIDVLPVCADFTQPFDLPEADAEPARTAVYFPGSTIGNLRPEAAQKLLAQVAKTCGQNGGLLIGIDLQKDVATIEKAYNDSAGVTAAFNLNLLSRINRELEGDFVVSQFAHRATYNAEIGRMEIYAVSQVEQTVSIGDDTFEFAEGEAVCTEYSYKYTISGFARLAHAAGFSLERYWTDDEQLFGVLYLSLFE